MESADRFYALLVLAFAMFGIYYLLREMKRKLNDSELKIRLSGDLRVIRVIYLIGILCNFGLIIFAGYKIIAG